MPELCRWWDRVVRVSKGGVARPDSQNRGGGLVTTGASGSEVRGEVRCGLDVVVLNGCYRTVSQSSCSTVIHGTFALQNLFDVIP